MAFSRLSSPGSMKRLLGIQMTPPDLQVVPPANFDFSRMTTDLPWLFINSPEAIEPPPQPITTQSNVSSNPAINSTPVNAAPRARLQSALACL